MSEVSVKRKLSAVLMSFVLVTTLGIGAVGSQEAYAHNGNSSHHYSQTVTKPGKAKARIISCSGKSCTVKWNKVSGATSYEIKCTPKSGSGKTVTKRVGKNVRRATVSGLKSGTAYNVRVRACKTVNGIKHCGNWSSNCPLLARSVSTRPIAHHSTTVYITNTGNKFHASGCRSLKSSKYSISRSSAIKQGYTACKICNP